MALVEARIRESIVSEEPLLHDIAQYVIEAGGKRIRPMVTLLAFQALGGVDIAQAIDLAAALEMIHSATLIHDDINDGGDMRRGRLAAYKKFGLQNALVTGDFLFVKAFGIGGRFDDDIVEITANVCAALAEGEIRQKRHAHDTGVTRSEYLESIQGSQASWRTHGWSTSRPSGTTGSTSAWPSRSSMTSWTSWATRLASASRRARTCGRGM